MSRKASNSKRLWSSLIKHKKAKKLIIRSLSDSHKGNKGGSHKGGNDGIRKEFKTIVQRMRK